MTARFQKNLNSCNCAKYRRDYETEKVVNKNALQKIFKYHSESAFSQDFSTRILRQNISAGAKSIFEILKSPPAFASMLVLVLE